MTVTFLATTQLPLHPRDLIGAITSLVLCTASRPPSRHRWWRDRPPTAAGTLATRTRTGAQR